MMSIPRVGVLLVYKSKETTSPEYLCVHQDASKLWGFPKGRWKYFETYTQGACRELLEETGMVAKEFILWIADQPVGKIDWAVFTFIAKGCETKTNAHLDAGEKITLEYVSFDQFLDRVLENDFNEEQVREAMLRAKSDPKEMTKIRQMFFD